MLRTNFPFLSFIESIYAQKEREEDIILKTFSRGSLLLQQGARAARVFIIKEGITKCYFREDNGKDYILEFLSEGEITGELEVIRNIPCLCNIEALTTVRAYALDVSFFSALLQKNQVFNRMILEALAERIINTSSRSSLQQLYTVEHGLKKILDYQAKQAIAISKEDMASYLGITVRSLNRALNNIKR